VYLVYARIVLYTSTRKNKRKMIYKNSNLVFTIYEMREHKERHSEISIKDNNTATSEILEMEKKKPTNIKEEEKKKSISYLIK